MKIKKLLVVPLFLILSFCISCGHIAQNIHIGPPEREIKKLYKRGETIYSEILDGDIAGTSQNWDKAISQFKEIAESYPNSRYADDAQYNLGLCYVWSYKIVDDSPRKAIEAFEYLIKQYPKSQFVDDAHYWKAYAYSLEKDYKRLIEEYEKFVKDYPKSDLRGDAISQIELFRAMIGGQQKKTQSEEPKNVDIPPAKSKKIENTNNKNPKSPTEKPISKKKPLNSAIKDNSASQNLEKPKETDNGMVHIKDIRFHSNPGFTRIVVDLTKMANYSANRLKEPDRIYLDIQNTVVDSTKKTIEINDDIISSVRPSQFNSNTARVVLDVKQAQAYFVFHLTKPDRVIVDVYSSGGINITEKTNTSPSETPKIPQPESKENTNLVKQLGLKVKTIVIDPGHGGKDPGAVSPSGTKEKVLVLDVAKNLKKLLESNGNYQVYLTRETDVFVELEKRTAFANEKGADIFISIHINSSKKPGAKGIETYYLSMASDEDAQATAALENASSGRTISELSSIIRYILRGAKIEESREFARTAQSRLASHAGNDDRGVKRAPFIVLIGANAPSILVELGFISNPEDEKLLLKQEYREKLTKSLAESIEAYIKTIDQSS